MNLKMYTKILRAVDVMVNEGASVNQVREYFSRYDIHYTERQISDYISKLI